MSLTKDKHRATPNIRVSLLTYCCLSSGLDVFDITIILHTVFTARKRNLGQGNIFANVCHRTDLPWMQIHPRQTAMDADPLDADLQDADPPPRQTDLSTPTLTPLVGQTPFGIRQQAGGRHPTGMHTCCKCLWI